jgi:hypothetical protein
MLLTITLPVVLLPSNPPANPKCCRLQGRPIAPNAASLREIFASYPNRVMVIKLRAEGKEKINAEINFSTPHTPLARYAARQNHLVMSGKAPGFVLRRTLKQVEQVGDQYKYPEIFDKDGSVLPHAGQVLQVHPPAESFLQDFHTLPVRNI